MRRLFHFSLRTLRRLLILLIVISALVITAGRLVTPLATHYRAEVADWVSELLGQPVTIGQLEGQWRASGPVLVLRQAELHHRQSNRPTLRLQEVRVAIHLLDSLRQRSPAVRKITFVAPRLRLTRGANGELTIGSLESLGELETESESSGSAFLLPRRVSLIDGEIIWDDRTTSAPPLHLREVQLTLRNDATRHQLSGSINLPGERSGRLKIAFDLHTNPQLLKNWRASGYLHGEGIDLAHLVNRRVAESYRFNNQQAEIELWGEWNQAGLLSLEGTTDWKQVHISRRDPTSDTPDRSLALDRLSSRLRLTRIEHGWTLNLDELQISQKGDPWPDTRLDLQLQRKAGGLWQLSAGASQLRVQDLLTINSLFPLPDSTLEQGLQEIQPEGSLQDLRLRLTLGDSPAWSAKGHVAGLNSHPWGDIPGVRNLDFSFWTNQQQGTLSLDAHNAALDFKTLFRDPLQLQQLTGDLTWQQDRDRVTIESKRILAENTDIHTLTRMRLEIPKNNQQSPYLDLQSDYWEGDASTTHRYLPTGIMDDEVVAWLDRSIGPGHVTHGSALVRGPLADFPYDQSHTGRFEVLFHVKELLLDYWQEWPPLQDLTAEVRFLNNRFDAWAADGRIMDSRLGPVHAAIDSLNPTSSLRLQGRVEGPVNDGLRLLRESPLRQKFATLASTLQGAGRSRLDLGFSLPITEDAPLRLDGALTLLNSSLEISGWPVTLNNIRGKLNFDQDRLFARDIRATADKLPIRVEIGTPTDDEQTTRISATAEVPLEQMAEHLPALNNLKMLSGHSQWRLDLDVPHRAASNPDTPISAQLSSDLTGTGIDLPPPFGKQPDEQRTLQLSTRLGEQPQQVHIRYADLLDAAISLTHTEEGTTRPTHIGITLGGEKASLPSTQGVEIGGRLPYFELTPWLPLSATWTAPGAQGFPALNRLELEVDQLQLSDTDKGPIKLSLLRKPEAWQGRVVSDWAVGRFAVPHETHRDNTPLSGHFKQLRVDPWLPLLKASTAGDDEQRSISRIELNSDKIEFRGHTQNTFSLQLKSDRRRWQGDFHTKELSGRISLPHDPLQEPVRLNMPHLALQLDGDQLSQKIERAEQGPASIDPTTIPAFEVDIGEVMINNSSYGRLQLITRRAPQGLELKALTLTSPKLQLSAHGSWQQEEPIRPITRLDLEITSPNFGLVLNELKLSQNLKSAAVKLGSHIWWAGNPLAFSLGGVNGNLSIAFQKGRFLKVDPGVGRLFGLLNLSALQRRLTLDFSDIFSKGFAFDTINGGFLLDEGDAYTNDFRMLGPSASVELSGRIGLADEDFDALVTITPNLSSSIPLAGAIAGGPAVGAALFIAQKLVGKSLDKVTQLQYMATGSWDNPILTPQIHERTQEGDGNLESEPFSLNTEIEKSEINSPTPATEPAASRTRSQDARATKAPSRESDNPFTRLLETLTPSAPTFPPESNIEK